MMIEYLTVPADQGAMAVEYMKAPESARPIRAATLRLTATFTLAGLLLLLSPRGWPYAILSLVFALLAMLCYPRWITARVRRAIERRTVVGMCPCAGGRHRMETGDDGLRVICDSANTLRPWSTVQRVVTNADHAFVVLRGGHGYPIPRETMLAGDLDAFVESLKPLLARPANDAVVA